MKPYQMVISKMASRPKQEKKPKMTSSRRIKSKFVASTASSHITNAKQEKKPFYQTFSKTAPALSKKTHNKLASKLVSNMCWSYFLTNSQPFLSSILLPVNSWSGFHHRQNCFARALVTDMFATSPFLFCYSVKNSERLSKYILRLTKSTWSTCTSFIIT